MTKNGTKTVTMTMLMRIGLDNLLATQTGKHSDGKIVVWHDIRKKVRLSKEDKLRYYRKEITSQGMQTIPNEEAIEAADGIFDQAYDLDRNEVRQLSDLLKTTEVRAGMLEWMEPLIEQLDSKEDSKLEIA